MLQCSKAGVPITRPQQLGQFPSQCVHSQNARFDRSPGKGRIGLQACLHACALTFLPACVLARLLAYLPAERSPPSAMPDSESNPGACISAIHTIMFIALVFPLASLSLLSAFRVDTCTVTGHKKGLEDIASGLERNKYRTFHAGPPRARFHKPAEIPCQTRAQQNT